MSTSHALLHRDLGVWVLDDDHSKNGTFINGRRSEHAKLADGDIIELGHTFLLFRERLITLPNGPAFAHAGQLRQPLPELATLVPSLAEEFERLEAVAISPVAVVIQGETGTGKEVVASAIHRLSARPGPFVAVNCGAIPGTLIESELFGYRKGAFSGANENRAGLIRSADQGTLFLDEIGDLPPPAQAALLRALQQGEVLPVGATQPMKVDFRLLAATHRDLEALVAKDQFRSDLLARISGFALCLPPLRERREDLGLLISVLLRRHLPERAEQVTFSADVARALLGYPWPLNIRELEKCLLASVALARTEPVELAHLPKSLGALEARSAWQRLSGGSQERPVSEADRQKREELLALLQKHAGNVTAVAHALGKRRTQVQRWIKRYGIDAKDFRS